MFLNDIIAGCVWEAKPSKQGIWERISRLTFLINISKNYVCTYPNTFATQLESEHVSFWLKKADLLVLSKRH